MDEKERIRIAYFLQGLSVRQIAREMQHSRKTVRKAIADPSPPIYARRETPPQPVIGPVTAIIDGWLEEDATSPKKQRHTAHRIYERLKAEHGFTGAESTVRRYVRTHRRKSEESFIPLCFDPGEDAQADFGEAKVIIDGREVTVQLFCIQLCYSRRRFVIALPFQKQEAFLHAHVRAFDFFGGVPKRISYDNLTAATVRHGGLRGDKRREIETFIAFRSHYLFASHFCNPGEPHEKGQIENLVGYVRRNWLIPLPRVKDFEGLNAYLYRKCLEEDRRVISGMSRSIGEMFAEERPRLLPLPKRHYECFRLHPVRSNKMSIVGFELSEARDTHQLSRLEARLEKQDLVILDEVGYVPFSQDGGRLLFNFISSRYERGSLIVTSNLESAKWTSVFVVEQLTVALLDRLTHHCHILEMNGDSYRFRESLKRKTGRT